MTYEVWSANGFEGRALTEADADLSANAISREYRGPAHVRDENDKVIARHYNGQRVIRKVAGFQSASVRPQLTAVPFTPRPARQVGFGPAA